MIAAKYWAIRRDRYFLKDPNATGWPYLTFDSKQAAQAYIKKHSVEGEPARITVTLKEVV
jgi:hypothetical protein